MQQRDCCCGQRLARLSCDKSLRNYWLASSSYWQLMPHTKKAYSFHEIPLVGYLRGKPFYLNVRFYPTGNHQVIPQAVDEGLLVFSGSRVIANLNIWRSPAVVISASALSIAVAAIWAVRSSASRPAALSALIPALAKDSLRADPFCCAAFCCALAETSRTATIKGSHPSPVQGQTSKCRYMLAWHLPRFLAMGDWQA